MISILQEADNIANGDRKVDYGQADSFNRIATIASIITNKELEASDVIKVMMCVKLIRESFKHKRDNLVDLCGYAELLNIIEDSNTGILV